MPNMTVNTMRAPDAHERAADAPREMRGGHRRRHDALTARERDLWFAFLDGQPLNTGSMMDIVRIGQKVTKIAGVRR